MASQKISSIVLKASPSFALAFSMDGRPFVAKETEPYIQYWLSERERVLLSLFSRRGGASIVQACQSYFRLHQIKSSTAERQRLHKAIDEMRTAGVLIGEQDDVSRYSASMVNAYVAHRPFPPELSELMIQSGGVQPESRVLDLAGGPGDLALALARACQDVTLMELSKGFVSAARRRARQQKLNLSIWHESCNRLIYSDAKFDVITISQALHWLDDVLICRGVSKCLDVGGSFFVVLGSFHVADEHPLSYVLGEKSILGYQSKLTFAQRTLAQQKRLTLLFNALDASPSPIVPVMAQIYRQQRPLGEGYVRGFLTPEHIAVTGMSEKEFWKDLQARCSGASEEQMQGTYDWSVLQFQRGGQRQELRSTDLAMVQEIAYQAPPSALTRPTVT
jgi:2-polyprenyl-3-methyl-5-hydroxy-6-metoxy-1,4-benzoquinol methylase